MSIYSFDTILLSAQKTGEPNLIGTSLSANGVNTVSLSTLDKGIAFNSLTPLGSTTTINVEGSVFTIDTVYTGSVMGLAKTTGGYTIFTANSALATVPLSAKILDQIDVGDPQSRRKYLYGYI